MNKSVEKTKKQVAKAGIMTVYDFMRDKKDLIQKALPAHITSDRLVGIFEMCIRSNSDLAGCSQKSLIAAIIQTAQLGLIPGNINHCYYVPFNNKQKDGTYQREVQFILGYRGMIELVNRSGKAVILSTECVYEHDAFEVEMGLNPILRHIPTKEVQRGGIVGCYCVAKNIVAGEKLFVYLTKEDIDKVRKASRGDKTDYSPWNNWYEEMAKKTCVKRICKLLPLSMDIQKKFAADETIKAEIAPDMAEVEDKTNWEDAPATDAEFKEPAGAPGPAPAVSEAGDKPTKAMEDLALNIEAAIKECENVAQLDAVVLMCRDKFINGSKDLLESQKVVLRELLQRKTKALSHAKKN
jgi:recombination protein RecT